MDYTREALGDAIRARREVMNGMTQAALGRAAGYGRGPGVSISRIETGVSSPSPARLQRIAAAMKTTVAALERSATTLTAVHERAGGASDGGGSGPTSHAASASLKERVRTVQTEADRRTEIVAGLADRFNDAHDRARDRFFFKFVEFASQLIGAPQPDGTIADDRSDSDTPADEARHRMDWARAGFGRTFTAGAAGMATGAGVGAAAAYTTFLAVGAWGTASTGATIASLSGIAATNATLAALGGGSLAAGGAGIAGGTAVLGGIVAAPAVAVAAAVVIWMVKRKRKELVEKLDMAEGQLEETRPGFDALTDLLPRASKALDDIAVHGTRALERWQPAHAPAPPLWSAMDPSDQQRYRDFSELCAVQIAIATIDFSACLTTKGLSLESLTEVLRATIDHAQFVVDSHV